jgi:Putative transposase, YhgA-like
MTNVLTLHQNFFSLAFKDKPIAIDALRPHLPPPQLKNFNWKTLTLKKINANKISENKIYTDVLFFVEYQQSPLYLLFHFEPFLGTPEAAFKRVIPYRTELWANDFAGMIKSTGLPPIVTILYTCFNVDSKTNPYVDKNKRFERDADIPLAYWPGPIFVVDVPQLLDHVLQSHGRMTGIALLLKYSIVKPSKAKLDKTLQALSTLNSHPLRVYALKYLFHHWDMDHQKIASGCKAYFDRKIIKSVMAELAVTV